MTPTELCAKYTPEKVANMRKWFDLDVQTWSPIRRERDMDMQAITDVDLEDPSKVAGPWPEAEWRLRHTAGSEQPCIHEDILTQYVNQVGNTIEMNPMGI